MVPENAPLLVLISNTFPVLRMFRRMEPLFAEEGYRVRLAVDSWRTFQQGELTDDHWDYIGTVPADGAGKISDEEFKFAQEALRQDAPRRTRDPRNPDAFARTAIVAVKRLMDDWKPAGLVFWNGQSFWHQLLAREAKSRSIPVCYMENGYFPGTVAVDAEGINYGSATLKSKPPTEFDAERIQAFVHELQSAQLENRVPPRLAKEPEIAAVLTQHERNLVLASLNPFLADDKRLNAGSLTKKIQYALGRKKYFAETVGAQSPELPTEKTVFLPLQVSNDTQITLYSPWIKNLEQSVEATIRAMPEGYSLIVRDHPEDRRNRSYTQIIDMVQRAGAYWAPTQPLLPIIQNADAIVTVNSTVGFEGLLWGKPVVTLGQAFYEGPGGSQGARSESELKEALKRAVSEPIDTVARERLLSHIAFGTHCRGGLGHLDANDQREAVQWILKAIR